jgi:hypothetical protein
MLFAFDVALAAFVELGATVEELTTPFENPEKVWFVNNGAYRMAQFRHYLKQHRAIMCPPSCARWIGSPVTPQQSCTTDLRADPPLSPGADLVRYG